MEDRRQQYIWTLRRRNASADIHQRFRYDEATDMVVIAHTAREARTVASQSCGDEGPGPWLNGRRSGRPFAAIKNIGFAKLNDNGSVKKSQVVVRDGTWSG